MLTTLMEASTSSLRSIAGSCPMTPQFIEVVNDATRMIMRRGDWPGTLVPIHVCVQRGGYVVWPRYVGYVRKLNVCRSRVKATSMWGDFLPYTATHWNSSPWWYGQPWGDWCGLSLSTALVSQGKAPWFQDIIGEGRLVRAYATAAIDIGKTVRIFGKDNNGQTLRTQNVDGTKSDGVVIEIQSPFGSTGVFVRNIERVLLDQLQGDLRLFAYDATNDVLEDIGTYEPGDTNPAFERHRLGSSCSGGSCAAPTNVVALVKLKFVPARSGNDLVLVENIDALKLMVQSNKFRDAGDTKGANEFEAACIRELNLGLNDVSPPSEIPVSINPFNGARIGSQQMF